MQDFLKNSLENIIKRAGDIILSAHSNGEEYGITAKPGVANFVTEYDITVQNFIILEVKKLFPECEFMAEEKDNDMSVLSAEYGFILDPIDGTTNFIRDLKQSSISLAYLEHGKIVSAVIYLPYTKELFYAEKGKGAYLNDKKIGVSDRCLNQGILAFGTAPYYRELALQTFNIAARIFAECADVRRSGSAAIDLAYLAAGKTDMFFELCLSPWDFAAGILIVTEAGGIITDIEGKPLALNAPSSVIAANKEVYSEFLNLFH